MKLPPIEKVHEALSALADNRIYMEQNSASIDSSDYTLRYNVVWEDNNTLFKSNDKATYWQGYPGYPIIAVLLELGIITYDKDVLKYFKEINWKALNTKHKRDYKAAVDESLSNYSSEELDYINKQINSIFKSLSELDLSIKRNMTKIIKKDEN